MRIGENVSVCLLNFVRVTDKHVVDNKNPSTKGSGVFWGFNVIDSLMISWMHHCQLNVQREKGRCHIAAALIGRVVLTWLPLLGHGRSRFCKC